LIFFMTDLYQVREILSKAATNAVQIGERLM
jgi:hypothetical protein